MNASAAMACFAVLTVAASMEDKPMDECCATGPAKAAALTAQEPMVCTLSEAELRERRDAITELLAEAAASTSEVDNGYAIEFEDGHTAEIVEFIELERTCCSFLEFTLRFAPKKGPVTLTITGPEGTKEFLKDVFARVTKPRLRTTTRTSRTRASRETTTGTC